MGGAMAHVCARYLAQLKRYPRSKLCVVSFGSPCVGNQVFAEQLDLKVAEVWRVICEDGD